MIIDDEQRRLHSRHSLRTMVAGLVGIIAIAITAPIWAVSLPSLFFLRFDAGFFVIAHGIIVSFFVMVYWFIADKEKTDRMFNISTHT